MDQIERNKVITAFKKKEVSTLVATDVAGNYILTLNSIILLINFIASSRVMKHYTLAELRYASFRILFKFKRIIDIAFFDDVRKYRTSISQNYANNSRFFH